MSTVECRGVVVYTTSYVTKTEITTSSLYTLVRKALDTLQPSPDAVDTSRRLVVRCLTKMLAHTEVPAAMCTTLLLGLPTTWSNMATRTVPFGSAVGYLKRAMSGTSSDEYTAVTFAQTEVSSPTMRLTRHSLLMDYIHRPNSEVFKDLSMLEFFPQYRKVNLKSLSTQARKSVALFAAEHSQHVTHGCMWAQHPYIPELIGGYIGKRNYESEKYCMHVLMLCTPWRSLQDLLRNGVTTFAAAFAQRCPSGVDDLSPVAINYLNNCELLHKYEASRQADLDIRNSREQEALKRAATATGAFTPDSDDDCDDEQQGGADVYKEFLYLIDLFCSLFCTLCCFINIRRDVYH